MGFLSFWVLLGFFLQVYVKITQEPSLHLYGAERQW